MVANCLTLNLDNKMKKMKKLIYVGFILLIALSSCEEQIRTFNGESQIGFETPERIFPVDAGDQTDTVKLLLMGPQASQDIQVTFEINDTATTAQEGVHFEILSKEVIIKAGTSLGELHIRIIGEGFSKAGESFDLGLTISGGDLAVAENFKTTIIRLKKKELDEILSGKYLNEHTHSYGSYECNISPALYEYTLIHDNFWDNNVVLEMTINPETNEVTINQDIDFFGDGSFLLPIEATGTFNVSNGSMIIPYVVYQDIAKTTEFERNTLTLTKLSSE